MHLLARVSMHRGTRVRKGRGLKADRRPTLSLSSAWPQERQFEAAELSRTWHIFIRRYCVVGALNNNGARDRSTYDCSNKLPLAARSQLIRRTMTSVFASLKLFCHTCEVRASALSLTCEFILLQSRKFLRNLDIENLAWSCCFVDILLGSNSQILVSVNQC